MNRQQRAGVLCAVSLVGLVAFLFVVFGRVFGGTAGIAVCVGGLLFGIAGLFPIPGDN